MCADFPGLYFFLFQKLSMGHTKLFVDTLTLSLTTNFFLVVANKAVHPRWVFPNKVRILANYSENLVNPNLNRGEGGGHIVTCDAKIWEKCLCAHHNNTALIKNITVWRCFRQAAKSPFFLVARPSHLLGAGPLKNIFFAAFLIHDSW